MMAGAGAYAGLVATALFAVLVFAVPLALISALVFGPLRTRLLQIEAAARAWIYLGMAALPLVGALGGLLASFLPSILGLAGVLADHCHLHPDHIHLCLQHPPQLAHTVFASMVTASVVLVGGSLLMSWLVHLLKTRRLVGQLLHMSRHDHARALHVVDSDTPLAFAAGLRAPQLFVSSKLVAQLSGPQLEAVIAHERAHATRHDALIHTLASGLSYLHFPSTRRLLLAELSLAAEQACDEFACASTGDRLVVAEAIIAVEKLFALQARRPARTQCATSHFNDSNVDIRVLAMLDAPRLDKPAARLFWYAGAGALFMLLALGEPLHHTTETLLGLIFH